MQWSRARGGPAMLVLLLGLVVMATWVPAPVSAADADDAVPPQAPSIVLAFAGLNEVSAEFGFQASAQIGKAIARSIHAANTAIQLRSAAGGLFAQRSLAAFFGTSDAVGDLDFPKVYCDVNAPAALRRCYVIAVQTNVRRVTSTIWIAVSRHFDPSNLTGDWCRYTLDARRNVGTPNASHPDFLSLGMGADKLVITTNQHRFTNLSIFTFAVIRVMNKLALANNSIACPRLPPVAVFQPSPTAGSNRIRSVQPVQHYSGPPSIPGAANPVYLVNTTNDVNRAYLVWRLVNLAPVVLQGPFIVVGRLTYDFPDNAPQPGTTVKLDTGDPRVAQAAGFGSFFEVVHATKCGTRACIQWVRFQATPGGASLNQQTVIGLPGAFLYKPGVAVNRAGTSAVVFHVSSALTGGFLRSQVLVKSFAAPAFPSPLLSVTPAGTCAYPGDLPDRTVSFKPGEYPGGQTDPVDLSSFWMVSERATSIGGVCRWDTRIVKIAGTPSGQFQLTVTKAGTGRGRVTSAPPGIDCGATCSARFDAGARVTLTAFPESGSVFGGFSGGGCSGAGACTVTLLADTTVTATFGGSYYATSLFGPVRPVAAAVSLVLVVGLAVPQLLTGSAFGRRSGTRSIPSRPDPRRAGRRGPGSAGN